MQHKIFTADVLRKLAANGKAMRAAQSRGEREPDHVPALKVFNPYGAATWIFTEIDEDGDTLFGLCDLGMGSPELRYASRHEIETTRVPVAGGRFKFPLERDAHWHPTKTLREYADEARAAQRLVA